MARSWFATSTKDGPYTATRNQALQDTCLIKPHLLSHNEIDPLLDYVLLVLISQVLSQFLPLQALFSTLAPATRLTTSHSHSDRQSVCVCAAEPQL